MAKRKSKSNTMKSAANQAAEVTEVGDQDNQLEAEADRDLTGGSVTLRWGRDQIAVVKRAAALVGVPYQTYLKQVVFKQAIADIEHVETVLARRRSS
jgi:predicted DNA binding CopG/RHH family protein